MRNLTIVGLACFLFGGLFYAQATTLATATKWYCFRMFDAETGDQLVSDPQPTIRIYASNKGYYYMTYSRPDGSGIYSLSVDVDAIFERVEVTKSGYAKYESQEEPSTSIVSPTDIYLQPSTTEPTEPNGGEPTDPSQPGIEEDRYRTIAYSLFAVGAACVVFDFITGKQGEA